MVGIGQLAGKKTLPLSVGEGVIVEFLQLLAEILDKVGFIPDWQVFIRLRFKLLDEGLFKFRFALILSSTP